MSPALEVATRACEHLGVLALRPWVATLLACSSLARDADLESSCRDGACAGGTTGTAGLGGGGGAAPCEFDDTHGMPCAPYVVIRNVCQGCHVEGGVGLRAVVLQAAPYGGAADPQVSGDLVQITLMEFEEPFDFRPLEPFQPGHAGGVRGGVGIVVAATRVVADPPAADRDSGDDDRGEPRRRHW